MTREVSSFELLPFEHQQASARGAAAWQDFLPGRSQMPRASCGRRCRSRRAGTCRSSAQNLPGRFGAFSMMSGTPPCFAGSRWDQIAREHPLQHAVPEHLGDRRDQLLARGGQIQPIHIQKSRPADLAPDLGMREFDFAQASPARPDRRTRDASRLQFGRTRYLLGAAILRNVNFSGRTQFNVSG